MATTYTLIEAKTLTTTTATVSFVSIPNTYTDLLLRISARSDYNADGWQQIYINFNGSTTSYNSLALYAYNGGVTTSSNTFGYVNLIWGADGNGATANTFGNTDVYIPNYASSNSKSVSADYATETNATNGALMGLAANLWSNSAAISSLDIVCAGGTASFLTNSTFYLYGISKT